jgi:hypothetical protein
VQLNLWNSENIRVTFVETRFTFGVRFWVDEEKYLEQKEEWVCDGSWCPRDLQSYCNDNWGIQVLTCPSNVVGRAESTESTEDPVLQGTILCLCIQPNQQALNDGVKLGVISSLNYYGGAGNNVHQPGVEDGAAASDGLTTLDCEPTLCVVDSLLFRSFFGEISSTQPLSVKGIAYLASGTFADPLPVEFQLDFEVKGVPFGGPVEAASSERKRGGTRVGMSLLTFAIILGALVKPGSF